MTDREIVKALEECAKDSEGKCHDMTAGALDLINRQKKTIDELTTTLNLVRLVGVTDD